MDQFLSSASLKSMARGQLLGKYGTLIGAYLLHFLCVVPVTMTISTVVGTNSIGSILIYSIACFLLSLLGGFFLAGESFIYLKVACGQIPAVSDLFHCFQGDQEKVLRIQSVLAATSVVSSLPAMITGTFLGRSIAEIFLGSPSANAAVNASLFLLYTIFYVAGTAVTIFVKLLLSQTYYLMLDFPQYTAPELIRMSIRLMKGHKGRLFYIQLSFFPLWVLSMFSCGIGILWLLPYMEATSANFYLDLIKKRAVN